MKSRLNAGHRGANTWIDMGAELGEKHASAQISSIFSLQKCLRALLKGFERVLDSLSKAVTVDG